MPNMGPLRYLFASSLFFLVSVFSTAEEINVFAAASLSDVFKELTPKLSVSGHAPRFNFGGSGTLARQILEGAPADVFLSADEVRVDQLEKEGLLLPGTRQTILINQLVVITPADDAATVGNLADLAKPSVRRIAIGDPALVPAGSYAKAHLLKLGLWSQVSDKCLPLDNVRAVLAAVEAGNADAGLVYRTDALISKKVRLAVQIPVAEGPKIVYVLAVLRNARNPGAAKQFASFLAGPEARSVFAKHGFLMPPTVSP